MFLSYSADGFPIVLVQETPYMGCNLTQIGGVGMKRKTYNIQFTEPFQTATRRANIIVNEITLLDKLKMGTNDEFSDISEHATHLL